MKTKKNPTIPELAEQPELTDKPKGGKITYIEFEHKLRESGFRYMEILPIFYQKCGRADSTYEEYKSKLDAFLQKSVC